MSPPRPSTTRRAFISAFGATAVGLSGCLSNDGPSAGETTTADPTTDPAETTAATTTTITTTEPTHTPPESATPGYYRSIDISLYETDTTRVANAALRGTKHLRRYEQDLIDQAIADGSTTFTGIAYEPLGERIYVERDGSYYRITRSIEQEREVRVHDFIIDAITTCPDTTPEGPVDPVPFEDLSPADKRTFEFGLTEYYDDDACFGSTRIIYYSPAAEERSVLISDSLTYVRYDGELYVVDYRRADRGTRTQYRFRAEPLGDETEYVATVAPEVTWHVEPDDLPPAERRFFDRLVEKGRYSKENPIPEFVDSFIGRLFTSAYTHPGSDAHFLEFEGAYYRVSVTETVT